MKISIQKIRLTLLEITAAGLGGSMWSEMKENAWRASDHRKGKGAIQLLAKCAADVLGPLKSAAKAQWELHVVAHSAGSILTAHALPHLTTLDIALKTLQLFAPAIRIDEFKEFMLPFLNNGSCPQPTLYILNEDQEHSKDRAMGPYGKSLLWLVSNAFEDKRGTPLLGMQKYLVEDSELKPWLTQTVDGLAKIVVSPATTVDGAKSTSTTHGGFDNDANAMNSVLHRILGQAPGRPFTPRDLQFE